MIEAVANLILGVLFEIIFIFLMIVLLLDIKTNKVKLFLIILVSYLLTGTLSSFTYNNHIIQTTELIVLIFLGMKLLYQKKVDINDIFGINFIILCISMVGIITLLIFDNYILGMIINRIILALLLLLFKKIKIANIYNSYRNLWNRRNDGRIKSISIRNVSLIIFNMGLYILNIFSNYYLR